MKFNYFVVALENNMAAVTPIIKKVTARLTLELTNKTI